jgi:hypothetical protein
MTNYQLLFLNSSIYFQSASVSGRRNAISQPAESKSLFIGIDEKGEKGYHQDKILMRNTTLTFYFT